MAEEDLGTEAPKGKKKLLIIIIAAVVLLAGGGGAAFFMMGSGGEEAAADAEQKTEQVAAPTDPVSYVNIAQPFVFNVTGDAKDRLVQIQVQLMVRGSENENLARYHSPLVESSLLATLHQQRWSNCAPPMAVLSCVIKPPMTSKPHSTKRWANPLLKKCCLPTL